MRHHLISAGIPTFSPWNGNVPGAEIMHEGKTNTLWCLVNADSQKNAESLECADLEDHKETRPDRHQARLLVATG